MMESPVHRRSFLTLLGGVAGAWPVVVRGSRKGGRDASDHVE